MNRREKSDNINGWLDYFSAYAPEPGAALARRLVAGGTIGLLSSRRRHRGIVRRLGRTLEHSKPFLKFSDAPQSRFQLPDQRQDEVILLRVAQSAEVDLGRHTELKSSRP